VTILEYIEETRAPEVRELLLAAHHFLQETLPPFATAGIKWRLPFYTLHRHLCYINRHADGITLGFSRGYLLNARPGVLLGENENLKHVRYMEIHSLEDLYSDRVQEVLQEAVLVDEMMASDKKSKRPTKLNL
jgi:hypothetical protein